MIVTYSVSHPLILQVSELYDLRPDLLAAQVYAESAGDPWAFRYEHEYFERYVKDRPTVAGYKYGPLAACSFGLMQVLLETALEHGFDGQPQQLFDERVGLTFGAKYLRYCLNATGGEYRRALARYNGSGARADAYATKVFTLREQFA